MGRQPKFHIGQLVRFNDPTGVYRGAEVRIRSLSFEGPAGERGVFYRLGLYGVASRHLVAEQFLTTVRNCWTCAVCKAEWENNLPFCHKCLAPRARD